MNASLDSSNSPRQLLERPALRLSSPSALEMTYEAPSVEREMTLRDFWRMLARRIWTVLAITGGITLAVTAWLALRPDYYEAKARIEIGVESENPRPNEGDTRNSVTTADPAYFSTQLQLIRSPIVLARVIKALQLDHNQIHEHFVSRGGRKLRKLLRLSFLTPQDAILTNEREEVPLDVGLDPAISAEDLAELARLQPYIEDLKKRLTVEPVKEPKALFKDTRLVLIAVDHPSPVLAAKIANGIADALVQENEERVERAGKVTNKYLVRRIDDLRKEISNDEIALASYSSRHQILSLDPAQNTVIERLTTLNRQLVEAENARKLAEANYREAEPTDAAIALAESDTKQLGDTEAKLADLRQKRAQLLVGATEEWPEVQEVQQQISALEESTNEIRARSAAVRVKNLKIKYRQELAHEKSIRSAFLQQRALTEAQNNAAVEYRLLQQQIDSKKNLLNGYLKRLGENDVAQAAMTNNLRVVDYAPLPKRGEAEGPLRLLWVSLAFILSFSLSIGVVFCQEYVDDSLRSSEEVKSVLQLRPVNVIPFIQPVRINVSPSISLRLNGKHGQNESLFLWEKNPHRLLVEAFRRLRVSMFMSAQAPPKSLLITSSLIGEGKTTIAANLAVTLAQTGASVLLIDGDTHRRRLSELFQVLSAPGLGDLLSGSAIDAAALKTTVVKHESGVSVLPAGNSEPGKAELLLESPGMRTLLALAESNFNFVVIDSPAITACSDCIVLAKITEAVLFVVHAGKSSREIVRYSQELLSEVGTPLLGVVLNQLPTAQYEGLYGSYYRETKVAAKTA